MKAREDLEELAVFQERNQNGISRAVSVVGGRIGREVMARSGITDVIARARKLDRMVADLRASLDQVEKRLAERIGREVGQALDRATQLDARLERRLALRLDELTARVNSLERHAAAMAGRTPTASGQYRAGSEPYLPHLVRLARLEPFHSVLDVGCGQGALAEELIPFLGPQGSYDGMDIRNGLIAKLAKNITEQYPRFRFHHADIYNLHYNPDGQLRDFEYHFPFEDETFDLVILRSVFTHMLPDGVTRYLDEIARVLKRGGRAFITFFLWNDEAKRVIALPHEKRLRHTFKHALGPHQIDDPDVPESAIALDEQFVLDTYTKAGLRIEQPIHYGQWCGRENYLSRQDIVVAVKE